MPDRSRYDLTFRPSSYWAPEDALEALLINIHGETRRRALRKLLERGETAALNTFLAENEVSELDREILGRIHPQLMGGEYLPADEADEVEIARVTLDSVTQDVISVRARQDADGYHYR